MGEWQEVGWDGGGGLRDEDAEGGGVGMGVRG